MFFETSNEESLVFTNRNLFFMVFDGSNFPCIMEKAVISYLFSPKNKFFKRFDVKNRAIAKVSRGTATSGGNFLNFEEKWALFENSDS